LIRPTERRPDKPQAGQEKIQEALLAARPDIVAFQEMGSKDALESLRQQLDSKGLKYAYWDHITGYDPDIHLSVLSRYPIVSKIPHTDISYRLDGKPLNVSRGFLEVEARINPEYRVTIFVAHLKSKRPVSVADQAEMRLMEALELRKLIDAKLASDPDRNIVVLGDMNDTKDSPPVRALISSGKFKLTDTRPAERNGDNLPNPNPRYEPRNVTWTHYYGKEDTYSRIDYILISPGLRQEWDPARTWIPETPNWGQGSDHRLIMATFFAEDR
jgi:endonuclease/exonuclease/phosphatase family metal-dependent hydrolase